MDTTFGPRFRSWRERAGLTLREVGAQTALHYTFVSKMENGTEHPPSAEALVRLARVVGQDPDVVLVAAGKAPPDLVKLLATDLDFVKKVRTLL